MPKKYSYSTVGKKALGKRACAKRVLEIWNLVNVTAKPQKKEPSIPAPASSKVRKRNLNRKERKGLSLWKMLTKLGVKLGSLPLSKHIRWHHLANELKVLLVKAPRGRRGKMRKK